MLLQGDVESDQMVSMLSKKDDTVEDLDTPIVSARYPYRIKKNYNIDHLSRMNFKRSDSSFKRIHPSKFNNRHMLGGLRRK